MRVGHDASSASLGWSLLPSTVIIVLALVNSAVSPAGTPSISTRPGSAALLLVSTATTGLLHLLVGACVHCVRSHTGKRRMWLQLRAHNFQCMTYIWLAVGCLWHLLLRQNLRWHLLPRQNLPSAYLTFYNVCGFISFSLGLNFGPLVHYSNSHSLLVLVDMFYV